MILALLGITYAGNGLYRGPCGMIPQEVVHELLSELRVLGKDALEMVMLNRREILARHGINSRREPPLLEEVKWNGKTE